METKKSIMVSTDGSQASKQAFYVTVYFYFKQAVEFCEFKNLFTSIIVSHVSDPSKSYLPFEYQSNTIQEDYKIELLSRFPAANYELIFQDKLVEELNVRNQILRLAEKNNVVILVVGFHGRKGEKQDITILGQTLRNSVYFSKIPLLITKKYYLRQDNNGFKFLVLIDGSKKSYQSLDYAIKLSFDSRDSITICFAPTFDSEQFGRTIKQKVNEIMSPLERQWQYQQLNPSYIVMETINIILQYLDLVDIEHRQRRKHIQDLLQTIY
ncbi:hypothetical protein pb186bvf_011806 [Paramecium bursaria]